MAGAAVPLMIAGTAISVYGQIKAGKAQSEIANANAAVLEKEAIAEKQSAKYDEDAHRERVKRAISTARVDIGRSGVDSPAHVLALETSAAEGEMDALAIRHGGAIAASRARSGARIQRAKGAAARRSGKVGAGVSLLTGGGRIAGKL